MKLLLATLIACGWLGDTSHASVSTVVKLWGRHVALHVSQATMSGMRNARLQRHFTRIGFRGVDGKPLGEDEMFKLHHEIFNRGNIKQKAGEELAAVQESLRVGDISKGNAQQQIRQIELARDKILALMAKKEQSIQAAVVRHEPDFSALGMSQPSFRIEEIVEAYVHQADDIDKVLPRPGKLVLDIPTANLIMSWRQLRSPITRSRADMYAKIRELSTKHSKELEVLGIAPNRKDTFSQHQMEKIGAEINSRFPTAQQVNTNDSYLEFREAYNTIYQAREELEIFLMPNSWHSAMFDVITAKRIASLHKTQRSHTEEALQLLDIDLIHGKVSRSVWNSVDDSKMPSFQLTGEWEQVVAEQYQLAAAKYRDNFSGAELQGKLQELNTAKDSLLSLTMPALEELLRHTHYKNFYRILDLDPAHAEVYTTREIKRAFYQKASRYHPDKNPNVTGKEMKVMEKSFIDIRRAAELLLNPSRKARVDALLGN